MPLALAAIPLLVSGGALATGAVAATAGGIATAGLLGSAAGLAADAIAGNQGTSKAASYLSPNTVNTDQLEQQALTIGNQNAAASRALQNEYTPWVTTGQSQSNQSLQSQLTPNAGTTASMNYLNNNLTSPLNSSLINQSAGVAAGQLGLGGQLDQGTMNAVTRQGLATAGTATPGGLGQGADVTARDLGLTSQQLLNQRLQNASQIGGQQLGASQANANAILSRIAAMQGLTQNQFQNSLQASNMYNNIQGPQTGLNPGSVASLAVGNQNSMNAYDASMANIYGQQAQNLTGLGAMASMTPITQTGQAALGNMFGGQTPSTINAGGGNYGVNPFMVNPMSFYNPSAQLTAMPTG